MNNHIRFSPRASLAMTGICIQQMGIWPMVSEHVAIKQKVITHTPLEKLQDEIPPKKWTQEMDKLSTLVLEETNEKAASRKHSD